MAIKAHRELPQVGRRSREQAEQETKHYFIFSLLLLSPEINAGFDPSAHRSTRYQKEVKEVKEEKKVNSSRRIFFE